MTRRDHPTVGRLALYLIAAAAVTGAATGWAYASGAVAWVKDDLILPDWMPATDIFAWLWIGKTLILAYVIWATERFGRAGWRWLAVLNELALLLASAAWVAAFLVMRDVTFGFFVVALAWIIAIFAAWTAGRATRLAGTFIWPVLVWNTVVLVLTFEVMRLNTGQVGQIIGFGPG